MPWGDRTGPEGRGPMTGRAAGYCAGYSVPGYANPVPGRGFYGVGRGGYPWGGGRGRAWGGGRGYRWRTWAQPPPYGVYPQPQFYPSSAKPEDEMKYLKEEKEMLEREIEDISSRLKELEESSSK